MSSLPIHRGVIVPMITPFTPGGAIDEPAVGKIVEHLIAGGVHGVFVNGTTGEAASIAADQRIVLAGAAVRAAKRRVLMYSGISGNCVSESIAAAKSYRDLGIDAVVAHPPYSYALPDRVLEHYFRSIADSIPIPLILYNMPRTTHVSISLDIIARLMTHPNIPAIKDSENSAERMSELIRITASRKDFSVLAGTAAVFGHTLRAGGHGVVPGSGNLRPDLYAKMYSAAMEQNWDTVEKLSAETIAVTTQYQLPNATLGESLARLKAMMADRGFCTPTMLPPLVSAAELQG